MPVELARQSATVLLIADDREPVRRARATALAGAGYDVLEAAEGPDASRAIAERRPALVLLAVTASQTTTVELCRSIKAHDVPAPLVLLVSDFAVDAGPRVQALDAGADGYLVMPEEAELLAHIRALLRLREPEEVLRESEQRLALALDAGGHAPFEVDLTTQTILPGPGFSEMFGVANPEFIRDRNAWRSLVLKEDRGRIDRAIESALERDGNYHVEYRVWRPSDGSIRWISTRASVHTGPDGLARRIVGVTTDITDRMASESMIRAAAEERRVALEIAQLGTWEFDLASGSIRFDTRAAEIVGLDSRRGYSIETFLEILHPDDRDRVNAAVNDAPDGGLFGAEYRVLRQDGVRSVAARGRLVAADPGGAGRERFVGTLMDVTEQKRTESELREQKELLTAVVDNIPVLLAIWDPALETFRFNKHFRDVLGWSEADAADGRFMERVYPDPDYRQQVAEYMRSLTPGWRDLKTTAKNGTTIDISWANVSIPGGTSIGIGVDVRHRKAVEQALEQLNQELADADRRKDEFIALLAHELRNPLAPVRTAVGILRARGPADPVLARCRDVINRQVTHMARLLDDLLDVSRLIRGKLTLKRTPLLLKDIIDAALEISRPLIEEHGHEVTLEGLDAPLLLDGDAARLTQVFGNLLNNAARYSEGGGRIHIAAHRVADTVSVSVCDTGIGIEPRMLDRIFDLFTQAEGAGLRSHDGLGIGLSLARRLVEMHGGTIAASSAGPGLGSEFSVTLPVLAVQQHAPAVAAPLDVGALGPLGRRVLVADDNRDAAEMLATLLGSVGCDVRTAHDGLAAVREAESFRPELVLLDIGMPGLDGYEACQRIRRSTWADGLMIVAITGWGQDQDVRRSASAGFDRHLVKPVDPDTIVQLVQEIRPAP